MQFPQNISGGREIGLQSARLGVQQPAEQVIFQLLGELGASVLGGIGRVFRCRIEKPRLRGGWCGL